MDERIMYFRKLMLWIYNGNRKDKGMLLIKIFLVGNLDELNYVRRQALPRRHMTKVSNTFGNWFTVSCMYGTTPAVAISCSFRTSLVIFWSMPDSFFQRRPEMDTNGFYGDTFSSGFGDFYTAKRGLSVPHERQLVWNKSQCANHM